MVTLNKRPLSPLPVLDPVHLRNAFRDAGLKDVHMTKVWHYVISRADFFSRGEFALDSCWKELQRTAENLPRAVVEALERGFTPCSSRVLRWKGDHEKGEGKLVVELQDGQCIETVIIEHMGSRARSTVCVSSQVGCKMGCQFCATGTMGLQAQLHAGEILEQLLHAMSRVRPEAPVRNVVFMGMGEPLDNYQQVLGALRVIGNPKSGYELSLRNVTVSTVGVPGKIRQLAVDCPGVQLALSLHAASQELRARIVPSAKGNPLGKIMEEVDEYGERTGKKVMLEYIVVEGTNASDNDAHMLGSLLARCRALVMLNLIPYNPTAVGDENGLRPPSDEACKRVRDIVASYRRAVDAPGCAAIADARAGAPILCTIRWSTLGGQPKAAACGQLVLEPKAAGSQKGRGRQGQADIEDLDKRPSHGPHASLRRGVETPRWTRARWLHPSSVFISAALLGSLSAICWKVGRRSLAWR